jgi:hypothetical protein
MSIVSGGLKRTWNVLRDFHRKRICVSSWLYSIGEFEQNMLLRIKILIASIFPSVFRTALKPLTILIALHADE